MRSRYYLSKVIQDCEESPEHDLQTKVSADNSLVFTCRNSESIPRKSHLQHFRQLGRQYNEQKDAGSTCPVDLLNKQVFLPCIKKSGMRCFTIGMRTLVFSIDRTLARKVEDVNEHFDFVHTELKKDGKKSTCMVELLPGCKSFLNKLSEKHEIIIYDMGSPQYVNQVVSLIDPDHSIISYALSLQNCIASPLPRKDLSVLLSRPLSNTSYISSSFDLPAAQLPNFIPLFPFTSQSTPDLHPLQPLLSISLPASYHL